LLLPLLRDTPERTRVVSGLQQVRRKLAASNARTSAAERVSAIAAELIERPQ
jgi:hypothetical protein